MCGKNECIAKIRENLPYIQREYGVTGLSLFGSVARGDNGLDSDVDIIGSSEDYYSSQTGMRLLAPNCTLITAIGEGINRINRITPDSLVSNFPDISWKGIVGIHNHIAHGYFELYADIIFEAVQNDIPPLADTFQQAITLRRTNLLQ